MSAAPQTQQQKQQQKQHGSKPKQPKQQQQCATSGCRHCAAKDKTIEILTREIEKLEGRLGNQAPSRSPASSAGSSSGKSPSSGSSIRFVISGSEDEMKQLCAKLDRIPGQLREHRFETGKKVLTHLASSEEEVSSAAAEIGGKFDIRTLSPTAP